MLLILQLLRLILWPVGKIAFALLLLDWFVGQRVYEMERRKEEVIEE